MKMSTYRKDVIFEIEQMKLSKEKREEALDAAESMSDDEIRCYSFMNPAEFALEIVRA